MKMSWKKRTAAVLASVALLSVGTGIAAQAENVEEFVFGPKTVSVADTKVYKEHATEVVGDEVGPMPRTVNIAGKSISVKQGKSYTTSFNMKNGWNGDPHTDFNVVVSDVTGKYVVVISSTTGYMWNSGIHDSERSKTHMYDCDPDATYTVTITNVGGSTLQGNVSITSFIV